MSGVTLTEFWYDSFAVVFASCEPLYWVGVSPVRALFPRIPNSFGPLRHCGVCFGPSFHNNLVWGNFPIFLQQLWETSLDTRLVTLQWHAGWWDCGASKLVALPCK